MIGESGSKGNRKMKNAMMIVVMLGVLAMAGTALADVISIDFTHANPTYQYGTASGTVTDANGHSSLPGQTGPWNELLVGDVGGVLFHYSTVQRTVGSLLDGSGAATGVSLTYNTTGVSHFAYALNDTAPPPTLLHLDMLGVDPAAPGPVSWQLDGLDSSRPYTLRMFGQEAGPGPDNFADFTATGSTTAAQNYVDLAVIPTAGGQITGAGERERRD